MTFALPEMIFQFTSHIAVIIASFALRFRAA